MTVRTLSVIMYARNHGQRVSAALEDILTQSIRPLEVLVVDDVSDDQTVPLVQEFQERHPEIRLIRHREPAGRLVSVNRALSIARGDYVYSADAGLRLLGGFFEKCINLLSQHPQAGFCYCDASPPSLEACGPTEPTAPWSDTPRYLAPETLAYALRGCHLSAHMAVFNRRILVEKLGFLRELGFLAEWFALVRIGLTHGACYIPETLTTRPPDPVAPLEAAQRDEALTQFLRLMRDDAYLDLLGLFIDADLISGLKPHIERVVLGGPEHWETESLLLIDHPLDLAEVKNKLRILFECGQAAAAEGRLADAQNIFQEAVREFPNVQGARLLLARVASVRGDHETAIETLKQATLMTPDDPEVHLQWGVTYCGTREYGKAEDAFRRALALDPSNLTATLRLAETLQAVGREEEAALYYNESLPIHPDNPELLKAVGSLALKWGQTTGARLAFQHALRVNPKWDEARRALVMLRAEDRQNDGSALPSRWGTAVRGCHPQAQGEKTAPNDLGTAMQFHFVMALWGEAFRSTFLDVVLPSQLTPGNLEAFRQSPHSVYRIYTTAADADVIRQAQAYTNLAEIVRTEIITMEDLDIGDKYNSMNDCHRHAVASANDARAAMIILCPDAIFPDGTFSRCADLAKAGKRAVMIPGIRTVRETLVAALLDPTHGLAREGWHSVGSRELLRLAMRHVHPLAVLHYWDATGFTRFPSALLWPVLGGGWLMRAFHMHPLMINPAQRDVLPEGTIDGEYVNIACPNPHDVYVVEDSDEMVGIEMTTGAQPQAQSYNARKYDVFDVVRWANNVATPMHRWILQHRIFLHSDDIGKDWIKVVQASDDVVESIRFFFTGLELDRTAAIT